MIATNHALTGAVIALSVKQPILVIPLAFAAHFAMDAIPHFWFKEKDVFKRNKMKKFQAYLAIDLVLTAIFLITIPLLIASDVSAWVVFFGMFACISPDLAWGWRFFNELREKTERKKNRLSELHAKIQWMEVPAGGLVEAVWFFVFLGLLIFKDWS